MMPAARSGERGWAWPRAESTEWQIATGFASAFLTVGLRRLGPGTGSIFRSESQPKELTDQSS
jgi:hypothetical protein